MNMRLIKGIFAVSAIYDGVLALAFLFLSAPIFGYFGLELPNHMGYLHFPALLLIVFGIMYWQISSDPSRFKNLIPYGIGLKVSYCAAVFYHWATDGVPSIWIPIAWIDFVFLIIFLQAWRTVGNADRAAA